MDINYTNKCIVYYHIITNYTYYIQYINVFFSKNEDKTENNKKEG